LRYFKLIAGEYQEQPLQASNPLVWLDDLEIGLGIWQGRFNKVSDFWLRWCDRNGNWSLTDTEQERLAKEQERFAKQQAQQQAKQERRAKQQAQQQAKQERLAKEQAKLSCFRRLEISWQRGCHWSRSR
jgi:hypothetical protein